MLDFNNKKIALVGPLPPPSGGMANQLKQLKNLLESEGVDVFVVQVNAPYKPAFIQKIKGVRAVFRFFPFLISLWKVAGNVDIFHIFANSGLSWFLFAAPAIHIAKIRRTPVIVNYRGGEAESFFKKYFTWVRWSLKFTDLVIVPSGFLRSVFKKWSCKAEVVPNIINLEKFTPANKELDSTKPVIIVPRNLEPIYDNTAALKAFRHFISEYPDAEMIVTGSGPELKMLQNLAVSEGIDSKVKFTGKVDNERMVELYQSADITLNPSLADNMPNSILESLASGVPVVTTDVGGIPYLVGNEVTSLFVKPGDYIGMSAALTRLMRDKKLRSKLISNGSELVKQFTWDNVKNILFDYYAKVDNR
jgi:glycosyltransferase involved in cell wall biosynthesis